MNIKLRVATLSFLMLVSSQSFAMLPFLHSMGVLFKSDQSKIDSCASGLNNSKETTDHNSNGLRKKIVFSATARFTPRTLDKNSLAYLDNLLNPQDQTHVCSTDCKCDKYISHWHPLIHAGIKPYTRGDGGLLNPKLVEYTTNAKKIVEDSKTVVEIEASGVVEADGIDVYEFDRTMPGHSTPRTQIENGIVFDYDSCYEMSAIEEAILGTLKERITDRQLSDLSDAFFPPEGLELAQRFRECIKKEWTTTPDGEPKELRPQCVDLMKRYMPRTVFWHSKFDKNNPKHGDRIGNGAIELKEFKVSVLDKRFEDLKKEFEDSKKAWALERTK